MVHDCKSYFYFMTRIMKNLLFCLREKHTEAADQLCGDHTADQILCSRDIKVESLSLLNPKFHVTQSGF